MPDDSDKKLEEIYTGKTKVKTVLDLMAKMNGVPRTRILDAGRALATGDIVQQVKEARVTAYSKIDFFQRYRNKVLAAAEDSTKRKAIPTKRSQNPVGTSVSVSTRIPKGRNLATSLTVDEIDGFKKIRPTPHGSTT